MSRKLKYTAKSLRFGNLYHLIDCLMLFGASLEKSPSGCCLRIVRSQSKWPAAAWAVIVAMSQDYQFDFLAFHMGVCGEGLQFNSRFTHFLEASHDRWYGTGKREMPIDVVLDEKALLFWLVGAWRENHRTMPMADGALKIALAREGVVDRETAQGWLAQRVPESVWKG